MVNFTKIIIPFKTSCSYFKDGLDIKLKYVKESNGKKTNKVKDKWLPYENNTQYLLENISNKITNVENPAQIGRSFILNNEIKHRLGFPQKGNVMFYPRGSKNAIELSFSQVCLHFFETHVGFCEIEFSVESSDVNDYVNANYFLSELKSSKSKITFKEKKKEGLEEISITFAEIIENIFEGMEGVESFEKQGKMSFVDKKPLVYGYCMVEDKQTMLENINIAKYNYKSTYKVTNSEDNYSFFDNSVIGASDLGVINMSCKTEDLETNAFFENTYVTNLKNQYFYLYLLLLNEKYTLTKRLSQYSTLSNKKNIADRASCETAMSELNTMLNKNILTKVRCDDSVVSLTPQIQGYFEYLKNVFGIENLLKLVDQNNKQITEMTQVYINYLDEIKNKELKKKEKKLELNKLYIEIFAYIVTNIVGTLTIFSTILEVMQMFSENLIRTWAISIPIVISAVFAISITLEIISKFKSAKLVKEKMEDN